MSKNSVAAQNGDVTPDDLIRQGVDEFKLAASQTATGIIMQGLAVLKIKQGCEKKQGGTEFPKVVMDLLGLSQAMAVKFAAIGEAAPKLIPVGISLPAESITTLYHIARMDAPTIADKIGRGVITPTATRDQVLEQRRVTAQRQKVVKDGDDVPELINETVAQIFAKLSKREQKILEQHMFETVQKERKVITEQIDVLHKDRMEIAAQQAQLRESRMMLRAPLSYDEFKLIRGMLHPDKHPGNESRAQRAFDAFSRLELICKRAAA